VIKGIVQNKKVWQMRWNKGAGVITLLLMLSAGTANAAPETSFDALVTMNDTGFMVLILLNLFLFAAFLYLVSKLNGLFKLLMKDSEDKVPETFMDKINAMLTDSVPVEQEEGVLMDHEYDGIHELDNNLPPWWLYGFYLSIAFAVIYLFHFHISGNGDLQIAEYHAEMKAAEEAKAAFVETQESEVDENNVEYLTDAATLAAGEKIFKLYCAACHGENGGSAPGGVGPNLTDEYWIHGGSMNDIYKTIKYGVPEKGMVSWQAQLSPGKIQEVSSYIKSLKGTNPPNPKEPQGEVWEEEETTSETTNDENNETEGSSTSSEEDVTMTE
ncbi:MAG: cbb3-type cytochrome c oxidase N-terminal domain-containing protein, partial [Salibacteraceae bacterium]